MRRIAFSLIAAVATASGALAQPTGGRESYGPPPYPQSTQRDAEGGGGYDRGYADDEQGAAPARGGYGAADQEAPDLARDLGLSAAQRAALQAYQAATTPTADEQRRMEADQRALAGMTTPQRLDAIAAQMRRDETDFARRADAVRRFYGQLAPPQQRRFDQLTGPNADPQGMSPAGQEDDGAPASPPPR